jgi:surfeit locus 1 family protein
MIICVCIFTALGVWQIQRLDWKHNLESALQAELNSDPKQLLTVHDLSLTDRFSMKRGTIKGRFITDKPILWRGQIKDGNPVSYIVAPLQLKNSKIVVPVILGIEYGETLVDLPKGLVTIQGLAKIVKPNMFRPQNDLNKNIWYRMDQADFKTYWNADIVSSLFFATTALFPNSELVDSSISLPNNHLQYAIFWFSMAILIGGLTIYRRFKG